jgi:hypothetical protein
MKKCFLLIMLVFGLASCISMPNVPSTATISITPSTTMLFTPYTTEAPTSTITPFPTLNPYPTVINSPNGELTAKFRINWDNIYEKPVIEIWDQAGSIIQKVQYQWDWDPLIAPGTSMILYGWAPDSSKIYFYYSFHYDSGAPTLGDVRDLQSFNVQTGETKYLLPGPRGYPTAFAFSSDMSKIAYIAEDQVGILDLDTGATRSVKILTDQFNDAGWIFLSPSGTKLVYHTAKYQDGVYAIVMDVQTMTQEVYWQGYSIFYYIFDGWTENENPRYMDYDHPDHTVLIIDLKTRSQTIVGTATPTP